MSEAAARDVEAIDVAYLARLARMYVTPEEASVFQGQLEQIVAYVRKLGEVDLADVENGRSVRGAEDH
jgi:aspartyl-tRNA(Asn)/glutamyl-tRNA(Gln) amidotransferase subunit C